MPAPSGNTNAEKWTSENTIKFLKDIDSISRDTDVLYLGEALLEAESYPGIWSYLKNRWGNDLEIIGMMEVIELRFEVKVFKGAMYDKFNSNLSMLYLKHHRQWSGYKKDAPPAPQEKIDQPRPYIIVSDDFAFEL